MKHIFLFLMALPLVAQTTVNFTEFTPSGGNWPTGNFTWNNIQWDPLANQVVIYAPFISSYIYSKDMVWYAPNGSPSVAGTWSHLYGTSGAGTITTCDSGSGSPVQPWPADRHPYAQHTFDTTRNRWILMGGVCNTVAENTTWALSLNATPTSDTWSQLSTTHFPTNGMDDGQCWYDSTVDAEYCYGSGGAGEVGFATWGMFFGASCSLSQTAAGCTSTNDWLEVVLGTLNGGTGTSPNAYLDMIGAWDPNFNRACLYGGASLIGGAHAVSEWWCYVASTKTWSQLTMSGTGPSTPSAACANGSGPPSCQQIVVYNSRTGKYVMWSWQDQKAYTMTPSSTTGVWAQMTNSGATNFPLYTIGGGSMVPYSGMGGAYDPIHDRIIIMDGADDVWEGQLNSAGGPPLTVGFTLTEALYPGSASGVARTNEPFCASAPIADSVGLTSLSNLTLSGTAGAVVNAGQFRLLGSWPDGNAKWVLACGELSSFGAGGFATVNLTDNGSGNFGGSNLATDNGTTITVATGTATFTIKKANFNILDSVVVGSTTVVNSSSVATRGLVLYGPTPTAAFPGNVTCSPTSGGTACSQASGTQYSSANDASSTCAIVSGTNGPATVIIRCIGSLIDGSAHVYMHHTTYETFYAGKSYVRLTVALRNADYDTAHTPSNDAAGHTFNTSYKGVGSFEVRINPNINPASGTACAVSTSLCYTIAAPDSSGLGCNAVVCSGAIGATATYIYQGQSTAWLNQFYDASGSGTGCPLASSTCSNLFTTDSGYTVVKDGVTQTSGTSSSYPQGWADISSASGLGVLIGMDEFAAQWPASLEFDGNGTDVRVGLKAQWNGIQGSGANTFPVYEWWPGWDVPSDIFLEFHTSTPTSFANDFLSFQHPLLARSTPAYYNSTNVFPIPLSSAVDEDGVMCGSSGPTSTAYPPIPNSGNQLVPMTLSNFCQGNSSSGPSFNDFGTSAPSLTPLASYKYADLGSVSGPRTQEPFRWSNALAFLRRGDAGRYLDSRNFFRYWFSRGWPHSDGNVAAGTDSTVNHFTWRSRPDAFHASQELDGYGFPYVATNGSGSLLNNSALAAPLGWDDNEYPLHMHPLYEGFDWYMLTGDPLIQEAIVPLKDWFLLGANSFQGVTSLSSSNPGVQILRIMGIDLQGSGRFAEYLNSIGDSDAANVLAHGANNYVTQIRQDLCTNTASGGINDSGTCTPPSSTAYATPYDPPGVSRSRGMAWLATASLGRKNGWCDDTTGQYRTNEPFQFVTVAGGLLALKRAEGLLNPSWAYLDEAGDLAYGLSQYVLTEMYGSDGTTNWYGTPNSGSNTAMANGFRIASPFDVANVCSPTGSIGPGVGNDGIIAFGGSGMVSGQCVSQPGSTAPRYDCQSFVSTNQQGIWDAFRIQQQVNGALTAAQLYQFFSQLTWVVNQEVGSVGYNGAADAGAASLNSVIYTLQHPSGNVLVDIPFTVTTGTTACGSLASGSYCLTFTPPAGSSGLRIKWSTKTIANSGGFSTISPSASGGLLGYDPMNNQTFTLSPFTNETWFGAQTTLEPALTPGTTMNVTVAAATTGLTQPNFSVKLMSSAAAVIAPSWIRSGVIR